MIELGICRKNFSDTLDFLNKLILEIYKNIPYVFYVDLIWKLYFSTHNAN